MATSYLQTTYLAFNSSGIGTGGVQNSKVTGTSGTITLEGTTAGSLAYLSNVRDPNLPQDAATKAYVDSLASSGVTWKTAVQAASTDSVDLSVTGVGITVDGVALTLGDRILIKNQQGTASGTDTANGVYIVNAGAWTRASDCAAGIQASGVAVYVTSGTVTGGETWVCNTTGPAPNYDPVNFGAAISFAQMSANPAISGQNTWVQYNDNGGFGSSGNFTFGSNTLTVNGTVSTGGLTASGVSSLQTTNVTTLNASTMVSSAALSVGGTSNLQTVNATTISGSALNSSGTSNLQTVNATTVSGSSLAVSGTTDLQTTNVTTLNASTTVSSAALSVAGTSNLQTVNATTVSGSSLAVSGTTDLQTTNVTTLNASTTVSSATLNVAGTSNLQTLNATTISGSSLNVSGFSILQNTTVSNLYATGISTGTLFVTAGISTDNFTATDITTTTLVANTSISTALLQASSITAASLSISGTSNLQTTNVTVLNASTSVSSASLNASGALNANSAVINTSLSSDTITATTSVSSASLNASGALNANSAVINTSLSANTVSATTSVSSGALYASGALNADSATVNGDVGADTVSATTSVSTAQLNASGVSYLQNVFLGDGTQATDASTGALVVNGGIAASKWVTAMQFNAVSDVQFKTNIEPLYDSLSTLKRIEGYSYDWKDSSAPGEKRQIGVLAQQLEEIGLDDLVNNIGSSKSVNYIGIIPILVEALKELSEKVDKLDPSYSSEKKTIKMKTRRS